jgi:hypothetical protein
MARSFPGRSVIEHLVTVAPSALPNPDDIENRSG